jgi:putative peptide zinc metalloprotease protein
MSTNVEQRYFVIPLSVQKERDCYLVGNLEMGDFYQFPEQGMRIVKMLESGDTVSTIASRLATEYPETFDIDNFVGQLTEIGFIYPQEQRESVQERLQAMMRDQRRVFSVSPRFANAVFSAPVFLCCLIAIAYAILIAIENPELRINLNAFYIGTNRTALLLLIMILSLLPVAMHELGHMLAAARHGIKSKYGIGNRLWTVVAESDLTGILALPKSQRYLPMLAGLLVDVLSVALLTILLQVLVRNGAGAFTIQVVQALILAIVISIPWQFNIFVKTDIYFVICTYFDHPDLDRDARVYLRHLIHAATFGRFGHKSATNFQKVHVLRAFTLIWLIGRIWALLVLFGVFLPTMGQYIVSAAHLLTGTRTSIWMACDTIIYVSTSLTILGMGVYMWVKPR